MRRETLAKEEKEYNARGMISGRQVRKALNIDAFRLKALKETRRLVPECKAKHMIYYKESVVQAYDNTINCAYVPVKTPAMVAVNPDISQQEKPEYKDARMVVSKDAAQILDYKDVGSFYALIAHRKHHNLPYPKQYGNGRPFYKVGELLHFRDNDLRGNRRSSGQQQRGRGLAAFLRKFCKELKLHESKAITPPDGISLKVLQGMAAKSAAYDNVKVRTYITSDNQLFITRIR